MQIRKTTQTVAEAETSGVAQTANAIVGIVTPTSPVQAGTSRSPTGLRRRVPRYFVGDMAKFQGKVPSRWQLWRDGVWSTFLSYFLACREQTRIKYVEGWEPLDTPSYWLFGGHAHAVTETLYVIPQPPTSTQVGAVCDAELRKQTRTTEGKGAMDVLRERDCAIRALMLAYVKRYAGDWPGGKPPVRLHEPPGPRFGDLLLENGFRTWYKYPDGFRVPITGKWDIIAENRPRARSQMLSTSPLLSVVKSVGKEWVIDSKFLSVVKPQDLQDSLGYNLQLMLYAWARWRITDECPGGIMLNVVRKPGERRKQDESLRDFGLRLQTKLIQSTEWDHTFLRIPRSLVVQDLRDWEANQLAPIMQEVRGWWEGRLASYVNPYSLTNLYGRAEMFNPLVRGDYSKCRQSPMGRKRSPSVPW